MLTKTLKIAFFVLGLSVLTLTGAVDRDEPVYDGKALSYWIRDESHGSINLSRPDLGVDGVKAVRTAGTNAIPFLLEWLGSPRAVLAFGVLGSSARSAVPELLRLATNETLLASAQGSFQTNAITALWQIGSEAVPALSIIATNHAAKSARYMALSAVALMGTNATAAQPALLESLKDPDENIVSTALLGLRLMHSNDPAVFVAAARFLDEPQPRLRRDALEVLAGFGDQALPSILRALNDADDAVSATSLALLVETAPQALTNATVLAIAAKEMRLTGSRRKWAAQLLRAAGKQAEGATPDLLVRQPGGWDLIFQEATNALRRLAPQLLDHSSP